MKCYYCENQAIESRKIRKENGEIVKIYVCEKHLNASPDPGSGIKAETVQNPIETLFSIFNVFIGIGIGLFVFGLISFAAAPVIVGLSLIVSGLIVAFNSFILRKIFEVVRYYCEQKGIKINQK